VELYVRIAENKDFFDIVHKILFPNPSKIAYKYIMPKWRNCFTPQTRRNTIMVTNKAFDVGRSLVPEAWKEIQVEMRKYLLEKL
jgi:hypothetical protein